ncbi:uncharacterized protein LOC129566646 isoform X2 [Sitodiplosis mosellana]|uniref:uncharacterized protein LOC129566646 isoform X2 n=1 Tax=Sitodiplosis mosellana TaxID=263140 RepID=UPI002444FAB7|nr:uncharacterized protein LOC129566646 isoform X2 [Sitodiplosis mosellana]
MYRLKLLMCTFVLCINCALSAPSSSLLSALLSPSAAAGASQAARQKPETGLTTYDQKQSGKYNIHLNIKDVAIIALDAGGVDSGVGDFDKPSSSTAAPELIHFEPDDEDLAAANQTDSATNKPIEEPLIKDPINKTQSVTILSENTASAASILINQTPSSGGIVVTTPTPAPEDLPPKLSLADIANVQSAQKPFPTKPNEIPVQIILEQLPAHKDLSRQRPNTNWHLRNRIRATPSANRRITPPHDAIGNNKHRQNYFAHANRRNCALDQNGQCQNSNRRISSPTLNGILSFLSFLSPQAMQKLE